MSAFFFSYNVDRLMRIQGEFQLFFLKRLLCCCSAHNFSNYNKNVQWYWFIKGAIIEESQPQITSFIQPTVQLDPCPKG